MCPAVGGRAPEPALCSVADINECRRYPGRLCGHKCENTPGSYYCSCTRGFRLSADGRSCEGEGGGGGRDLCLLCRVPPRLMSVS